MQLKYFHFLSWTNIYTSAKKYSLEAVWKNIKKGVDIVWDKVYIIPTASEADKFLKQKQNFWNI